MRFRTISISLVLSVLATYPLSAGDSHEEKREKTRKMAARTLAELYKLNPSARDAIQKSAGYAVFNNTGVNLLVASTASGSGVAVDASTRHETFMRMISAGVGIGAGVKNFQAIFVFQTPQALTNFIDSGWDGSAQADAAAKLRDNGGAYSGATSVSPGVWVYQIIKSGLAAQATLQGTKYYKDDDLNKAQ